MAFADLADLVGTIEDYLERADLDTRIPTFVRLAEVRLDRRLNLAENESVAILPLASGASPLPDDYRAWRSLTTACGRSLDYLSPHAFFAAQRLGGSVCDASFTIVGAMPMSEIEESVEEWTFGSGNALVRVGPGVGPSLTLLYRQGIPPLGRERPSNWLLERYPDLYLYGALLEAAPFLRNDGRILTWRGMLDAALADVAALDRDARWGRSRIRTTEPTP